MLSQICGAQSFSQVSFSRLEIVPSTLKRSSIIFKSFDQNYWRHLDIKFISDRLQPFYFGLT